MNGKLITYVKDGPHSGKVRIQVLIVERPDDNKPDSKSDSKAVRNDKR